MIRQGARRADSQSMMMGSSTAYNESFLRQSPRNFNRYQSIAENSLMSKSLHEERQSDDPNTSNF